MSPQANTKHEMQFASWTYDAYNDWNYRKKINYLGINFK